MYVTKRSYHHSTNEGFYTRQATLDRQGTMTSNPGKNGMSLLFTMNLN